MKVSFKFLCVCLGLKETGKDNLRPEHSLVSSMGTKRDPALQGLSIPKGNGRRADEVHRESLCSCYQALRSSRMSVVSLSSVWPCGSYFTHNPFSQSILSNYMELTAFYCTNSAHHYPTSEEMNTAVPSKTACDTLFESLNAAAKFGRPRGLCSID